jgi:hypothetical protein
MDIFKKLGITVGHSTSLIQESVSKSLTDNEIAHNNVIRKGAGLSPRDRLEQQLSKGGIMISPMSDDEMADEDEKMKAKVVNPHLKGSHGEEFHSDNDKQVEKMITEGEVIQSEFDHEKPMKVEFKSMSVLDALSDIVKGDEIVDLVKAKYTKRTGSPGHYKYEYGESAPTKKEIKNESEDAKKQASEKEGLKKIYKEMVGHFKRNPKIRNAKEISAQLYKIDSDNMSDKDVKFLKQMADMYKSEQSVEKSTPEGVSKKESDIVKGDIGKSEGEGSRGGHIIGHTKSGKPIYEAEAKRAISRHNNNDFKNVADRVMANKDHHQKMISEVASRKASGKDGFFGKPERTKVTMKDLKQHMKIHHSVEEMGKAGKYCKSIDNTLDDIVKGIDKAEMPEGVSKKEFKKMANLHENSEGVAEKKKASPFIKSQGPGGIVFDFGFKTGNALADHATALLNQNADPVQSANANYTANSYNKALESYVNKGEQAYMQEATPYGNVDEAWSKQLNTPMDVQVKEAFEKGQLVDDNSRPAVINNFNKTEMTLGGQIIKATSETDAALIEMMRSSLVQDDGTGMIAEIGGGEGRVAEIS